MFDSLIKAIQAGVEVQSVSSGAGDEYWSRSPYLPPAEPTANSIKISTLTGLCDYIKNDLDGEVADAHIQVVSPTTVQLCNALVGRHRQRETFVVADCKDFIGKGFNFGQWMDTERFIIDLQAQFEPTDNRGLILSVVGSMTDEEIRETDDDGVSQQVTTRAGIRRKEQTTVPNPVALKPYRTFVEVDQPGSPFVLRLRRDRGVEVALFEAGGGKWKSDAVLAIADYLREAVDIPVLA